MASGCRQMNFNVDLFPCLSLAFRRSGTAQTDCSTCVRMWTSVLECMHVIVFAIPNETKQVPTLCNADAVPVDDASRDHILCAPGEMRPKRTFVFDSVTDSHKLPEHWTNCCTATHTKSTQAMQYLGVACMHVCTDATAARRACSRANRADKVPNLWRMVIKRFSIIYIGSCSWSCASCAHTRTHLCMCKKIRIPRALPVNYKQV